MKQKISILLGLNLWFITCLLGQVDQYNYQRALGGINAQWHQIDLPETIYEKVNPNFSDIRIYGITSGKDTVEAPYLLKIVESTINKESRNFKLINTSNTPEGQYFTFELAEAVAINQIKLDFLQENFDWTIKLEGSQNQREWFTIKDDYRLVSIKNQLTDYQFSTIQFPTAKYRYHRIFVKTKETVTLKKATLDLKETTAADYQSYPIISQNTTLDKKQKTTIIELELSRPVPVSFLEIEVADNFDFYRSINIQYLADSVKTEKEWRYQYRNLERSVLSSLESNEFIFKSTQAKKIKIIIKNQDNTPLTIRAINIKGYQHQLIARFTESANYFLTYGRKKANLPSYDIRQFEDKIPQNLSTLTLAEEQTITKVSVAKKSPFFENKLWLWGLMSVIILVLGWFTLKMLKDNDNK